MLTKLAFFSINLLSYCNNNNLMISINGKTIFSFLKVEKFIFGFINKQHYYRFVNDKQQIKKHI